MRRVGEELGNTPAVARTSYVSPAVVEQWRDGRTLDDFARRSMRGLSADETALLALLRSWRIRRCRAAGRHDEGTGKAGPLVRLARRPSGPASRLLPTPVRVPGGSGGETGVAFRIRAEWYPPYMAGAQNEQRRDDRPVLLFFSNRRSGPARRMSSLVAWFGVTEKKRLRVVQVDTDANEELARSLDVSTVPTLVLLRGKTVVDRLDGRATGKQILRMISPHVVAR